VQDDPASRQEAADRLEYAARYMALGVVFFALLVVIDFATAYLVDDRRIDAGLLIACGLGLSAALGLRGVARRLRQGPLRPGMSVGRWVWFAASSAMTLAVMVVLGYLVGGRWVAIGLPAAVLATTGVVLLVARRRASA
jgi:hypothetical protein